MKQLLMLITTASFVISCSTGPSEDDLKQEAINEANATYATYFEASKEFNPLRSTFMGERTHNGKFFPIISEENRQKRKAFETEFLNRIKKIDPQFLTGQDRLSYEVFIRDRQLALEGYDYPGYLLPVDQMNGIHNFIAQLGSGQSAQPFKNLEDYRLFMERARGFITWLKSAETAMRQGMEQGIVQPEIVVRKLLPQFQYHLVENPEDSVFAGPLKHKALTELEMDAIKDDYLAMIAEEIIPAYQSMYDFLLNEYLPEAKKEVGLSSMPNGKKWYEYAIKVNTTLDLAPEVIHEMGQKEVARILSEMKWVKEQRQFEGSMQEFFEHLRTSDEYYFSSIDEMVKAYDQIRQKINKLTPKFFNIAPKADYVVRPVESFRAASSAGASYQAPSVDGTRSGIFYINGYNLKAQPKFLMETLSIHEASPGHHFQVSIQQELTDLPAFRRFGGYTVYSEGWALYAESLGKEMGLFTDPMMWYGRLVDEQLRAMRLVVDTGLHAMGWSREQAINFMLENSSMNETDVIAEVERYIVMPGQALGYKLGQFKIRELREFAEAELKDRFDIKEFHTQILKDGALPMPILDSKIRQWVSQQKLN